jgi:hypothetical protein
VSATRRALGALLLVAALAGCKSKPAGDPGLEDVNASFTAAGLKLDPFVPTDAQRWNAQLCLSGRIEGVEAVLCQYATNDAPRLAHKTGEEWIGTAPTGTTLDRGRILLVLADRAHVDPNGRAIHKITQAFQGKR